MLPHWSIVSVMFLPMLAAFHTPVEFDGWAVGKVDPSETHNNVSLSGGNIYDVREFPNVLQTRHGFTKFWGIPTESDYQQLVLKLAPEDTMSFVYNIGYIVDGNLTAASYDVWYKASNENEYRLSKDESFNNVIWRKGEATNINEIKIVLTGWYVTRGILAFAEWGIEGWGLEVVNGTTQPNGGPPGK